MARLKIVSDEKKSSFSSVVRTHIITDTNTGVQYLVVSTVEGISVTPLLDKDGRPIVSYE